ncbi:MAG: hypothetical protein PHE25_04615 [Candidatus Gracilibacteria bacterium]|nr:hypothetical protein [Candidatus Gracilibacteria bacterium]
MGYKILVTNKDGNVKTLSIGTDKNNLDNWDAKQGLNKYQLFVMGSSGELAKSNEITLNMGPNGGYDFELPPSPGQQLNDFETPPGRQQSNFTTQNNTTQIKDEFKNQMETTKQVVNQAKDYAKDQIETTKKSLTQEQLTKVSELMKTLEVSIKYLRENITKDNLDEIKTKADELKAEYLQKFDDAGLSDVKNIIESRFEIFYQNNFVKKPEIQKTKNDYKKQILEARMQAKMTVDDLKMKYKQKFVKQLESKLATLSTDKIKNILAKIDIVIEKYNANTEITQEQKDKFIAQLNALKELLQEKLDEIGNSINIDEILAE